MAFVEFQQYKTYISDNFDAVVCDDGYMIDFHDKMPESLIVYGEIEDKYRNQIEIKDGNILCECMIRGYLLFRKYVAVGSDFEINIDYQTKYVLINQMYDFTEWMKNIDTIDAQHLYCLYDRCIDSTYKLLQHSYTRFRHTQEYRTHLATKNE